MVRDLYNPNIQDSNLGDKLSDMFLSTNKVHNKNMFNNYELQKAININKYEWNKQGMIQAGINPLIASNNLGSLQSSQATSQQSGDNIVKDILKLAITLMPMIADAMAKAAA